MSWGSVISFMQSLPPFLTLFRERCFRGPQRVKHSEWTCSTCSRRQSEDQCGCQRSWDSGRLKRGFNKNHLRPRRQQGIPKQIPGNIRIPQGSFCSEAESRAEHTHPSLTHKHAWVLRWKTTKGTMTRKMPLLQARGLPVCNAGYLPHWYHFLGKLALRGDSHGHSPLPCRSLEVPWPCTYL